MQRAVTKRDNEEDRDHRAAYFGVAALLVAQTGVPLMAQTASGSAGRQAPRSATADAARMRPSTVRS